MKVENLGVVYRMGVEDFEKAIFYYLKDVLQQDIREVSKIEHEYVREEYPIGIYDSGYREIFDRLKVVCK